MVGVETTTRRSRTAWGACFNGATPWLAWRHEARSPQGSQAPRLQWGHALVGVETRAATIPVAPKPALQWGHALVGVETLRGLDPGLTGVVASMGPRLGWRGDGTDCGGNPVRGRCFNGATPWLAWRPCCCPWLSSRPPMLQWGHALVGVETGLSALKWIRARLLQWGHALVGVETASAGCQAAGPLPTSMGPRLGWRGDGAPSGRWSRFGRYFNGATPWLAWRQGLAIVRLVREATSMGPRLGWRGDPARRSPGR